MAEEIAVCRDKLEMSWSEIARCAIRGAEAAFIDDPKEKAHLIETVRVRSQKWAEIQNRKITNSAVGKAVNRTSFGVVAAMTLAVGFIIFRRINK